MEFILKVKPVDIFLPVVQFLICYRKKGKYVLGFENLIMLSKAIYS